MIKKDIKIYISMKTDSSDDSSRIKLLLKRQLDFGLTLDESGHGVKSIRWRTGEVLQAIFEWNFNKKKLVK